jgi:polyphosphate kinase 2 (PPK2 family)
LSPWYVVNADNKKKARLQLAVSRGIVPIARRKQHGEPDGERH